MLTPFLKAQQARMALDDGAFARWLGMERETWTALGAGQLCYSATAIARILTRHPNALADAIDEMRRHTLAPDAEPIAPDAAAPRNGAKTPRNGVKAPRGPVTVAPITPAHAPALN
jgi:hypothetical protein